MADEFQDIQDRLVLHQIRLLRLGSSWSRRFIDALDSTEPQLRAIVEQEVGALTRGRVNFASPEVQSRLRRLRRKVEELRGDAIDEAAEALRIDLEETQREEVLFMLLLIALLGRGQRRPSWAPTPEAFATLPINGRTFGEWIEGLKRSDADRIVGSAVGAVSTTEGIAGVQAAVLGSSQVGGRDGATQPTRTAIEAIVLTTLVAATAEARKQVALSNRGRFGGRERWVSVLDTRTTPECRALSGRIFEVGVGPQPGFHMKCRSLRVPVPDDAEEGDVESYNDWLGRQSADVQDEVLGETRAVLFRDGGLTMQRFVDDGLRPLTLEELARREAAAFRRAGLNPDEFR